MDNIGTDEEVVALKGQSDFPESAPLVAFVNATVTWPAAQAGGIESSSSSSPSGSRTPGLDTRTPGGRTPGGRKFLMSDLSVDFPIGELSLVCGPLGSGKTLLLLGKLFLAATW